MFERLPPRVTVYEVGPRDGLQNEKADVPTDGKLKLIEALVESGLRVIEATSFVSPRWIPNLADAEAVAARLPRRAGVRYAALVPNAKGLERAVAADIGEVAVFLSATESHTQKNTNRTVAEALAQSREVCEAAHARGLRVRGYLSTVWSCPYEGPVPVWRSVEVAGKLARIGVDEISLGDTLGTGTPRQTLEILRAMQGAIPAGKLAMHLHDTRGTALANALVGLELGITTFDASVGGLGGCPYAPGAAGNLATEDLVYTLHGMGIETGVDLARLVEAGVLAQKLVGRELPGKVLRASLGEKPRAARPTAGQT